MYISYDFWILAASFWTQCIFLVDFAGFGILQQAFGLNVHFLLILRVRLINALTDQINQLGSKESNLNFVITFGCKIKLNIHLFLRLKKRRIKFEQSEIITVPESFFESSLAKIFVHQNCKMILVDEYGGVLSLTRGLY